jgi:hypothetical protein
MSERSEFRSRREGLRGNGVKNLNGSEAISQNLFISGNWKCWPKNFIDCKFKLIFIKFMPLKKETDD